MSEQIADVAPALSKQQVALDVTVVLAALATIPLTVLQERGANSAELTAAEWVVWGIFTLEFLAFAIFSPRTRLFQFQTAGKLAVVALSFPPLPNFLALVSLARLTRALQLLRLTGVAARGLAGLKEVLARRGLAYLRAVTRS